MEDKIKLNELLQTDAVLSGQVIGNRPIRGIMESRLPDKLYHRLSRLAINIQKELKAYRDTQQRIRKEVVGDKELTDELKLAVNARYDALYDQEKDLEFSVSDILGKFDKIPKSMFELEAVDEDIRNALQKQILDCKKPELMKDLMESLNELNARYDRINGVALTVLDPFIEQD